MIVGLDFHSTAPSFLKEFWSSVRIGEALGGGTFHPKLYLFKSGDRRCCVMGSSNFTSGGFGDNTELNISIEGNASDSLFSQISNFINAQASRSNTISTPVFDEYEARYKLFMSARKRLAKFRASERAKARDKERRSREAAGNEPPAQLNLSWTEFRDRILAPERSRYVVNDDPDERTYLKTAERCQVSFAQYGRLAKMPLGDRKFVAGTTGEAGWFGSMRGTGFFEKLVNRHPAKLDAALDHIPLKGAVSEKQFNAFAAGYERDGGRMGTASRLLAMKRPDLFVCINSKNRGSKNRDGIASAFGVPASSLKTFAGYWDAMQRIWSCPWWKAPEPKGAPARRIWKARVALLDSLYYIDIEQVTDEAQ